MTSTPFVIAEVFGLGGPEVAAIAILAILKLAVMVLVGVVIFRAVAGRGRTVFSRYCPHCGRGLTQQMEAPICSYCGQQLP